VNVVSQFPNSVGIDFAIRALHVAMASQGATDGCPVSLASNLQNPSDIRGRSEAVTRGNAMARKATAAELILESLAVAQGMGCSFEELIGLCQDLTWNQIFLEVDRLSREGRVQLSQAGPGTYRIRLPEPANSTPAM
jgi:hypothetical protein